MAPTGKLYLKTSLYTIECSLSFESYSYLPLIVTAVSFLTTHITHALILPSIGVLSSTKLPSRRVFCLRQHGIVCHLEGFFIHSYLF